MKEGFSAGERAMQDRFDSRRLADKVQQVTMHDRFTERDRQFVQERDMFFLATADADGHLDCSYKGGDPGFVRIVDDSTLAFPHYDGNGMFMSSGNILDNSSVGMLFIDWQNQFRMRVNGSASIDFADPLMADYPEAQFIVRVKAREIFPNCPRYIHKMELVERSKFVPRAACATPQPDWKASFEDVLPEAERKRRAGNRPAEGE